MDVIELPTEAGMKVLLAQALAECDAHVRSKIESFFIPLQQTTVKWEYGAGEQFPAWVFANLQERSVLAVFCHGGHGALGSPWGLVFRGDQHFGMDCSWYSSFRELFVDWGLGGVVSPN